MISKLLKLLLLLSLFSGCGNEYGFIEPGRITSVEIHFRERTGKTKSINCLYSVPLNYHPEKAWPLIITLPGDGSNAAAFHDLWKPVTDSAGFVLLTPQGENVTPEGFGFSWGENAEQSIRMSMNLVQQKVHIDREKIYLTGFSSGGTLTYLIGLKYPHIFKGIAPLGASFRAEFLPGTSDGLSSHSMLNGFPVYIGHGTLERNFDSDAKLAESLLKKLGCLVKLTPYEGVGHGLPKPMEDELARILNFLILSS
jgi:predicted esterase